MYCFPVTYDLIKTTVSSPYIPAILLYTEVEEHAREIEVHNFEMIDLNYVVKLVCEAC